MNIRQIEIKVDGQTIRGNIYEAEDSNEDIGFIFIHGWTGLPNEDAAAILANNGFTSMTISLRGHNNSDGDINVVSRQDSLKDAVVAYDFFKSKEPKITRVGLIGNSYGGYTAALLSTERSIDCLSLRVPAGYPDEGFNEPQMGHGNDDPFVLKWRIQATAFADNIAYKAIHNFAGNIQIIEAEHDNQVHTQTVKNYVNAISNIDQLEYHMMKDWPHSLGRDPKRNKEFQEILLAWVNKQTKD